MQAQGRTIIAAVLLLSAAAPAPAQTLDDQLRGAIHAQGLTGDPTRGRELTKISDPLPQLGMRLFFSKSLGGVLDSACASCHHPALGGADGLSLPVGTAAVNPALLGPGRKKKGGVPAVPRNAPTTFNAGLYDHFLFHDGRVESLAPQPGANGAGGPIRTPDVAFGQPDPEAGPNLPAAQSRFPVTAADEMRGGFAPKLGNDALRQRLAARIGNYGAGAGELSPNDWLPLFEGAFGVADTPRKLVNYANIETALAAYERSQVFVESPWKSYVAGDDAALSDSAKRGALMFLSPPNRGGAGCSGCHRGDTFTDERFHTVAFPQIGPGKGDGTDGSDDFGRERESGDAQDLYAVRTPSLLNVALTAPYGHAGAYATLTDVVHHYRNPRASVESFFANGGWCQLAQFKALGATRCAALYPHARDNSELALAKLDQDDANGRGLPPIRLNDAQVADIVAFLQSLTDRCAADPACRAQWVPDAGGAPDAEQLEAVDAHGKTLD
jgi:cytochrome c peroxidase